MTPRESRPDRGPRRPLGRARGPAARPWSRPESPRHPFARLLERETLCVAALLAAHLTLAVWGAAKNSVTFDENFHLPAGVMIVARGDYDVSPVNPPLIKSLCALPALVAGARLPDSASVATRNQWAVGESFMRRNADRYHRVFFAARMVVALISAGLGLLVWRFARRMHGPGGGLLGLAFYAFSAEALAHAGVATGDVATGFAVTATLYAFWRFTRTGRRRDWLWAALSAGVAALTRFSCVILAPILLTLLIAGTVSGRLRRPARAWIGWGLLGPAALAALALGYRGHVAMRPLSEWSFQSRPFQTLQARLPGLPLPLPDSYIEGLDIQSREGQGETPWYLFGRIRTGRAWYYFPLALLFKWPLGFLGALAARAARTLRGGRRRREAFALVPALFTLLGGMFALQLYIGIRYLFPLIPLLCVWLGGLAPALARMAPRARLAARRWALAGAALATLQAGEVATAAPWYLSFFNAPSGGPGGGFRLINDSNVDWGQGLIALRDELRRRGITRIHLTYHGTTDPAVYGIDYVPYGGGYPGPESEWVAISSYYFVGLWQRMTLRDGRTKPLRFDFSPLWSVKPEAVPAGCMYLFRVGRTPSATPP